MFQKYMFQQPMCLLSLTIISTTIKTSQTINDLSAAHVVVSCVSSQIMRCRSLKRLLDHQQQRGRRTMGD